MLVHSMSEFDLLTTNPQGKFAVVLIQDTESGRVSKGLTSHVLSYEYSRASCTGLLSFNLFDRSESLDCMELDFTHCHALSLSMFYHAMKGLDVDNFYVQCGSGVSTSPAIVAALHRYREEYVLHDEMWLNVDKWPKEDIYRKMCNLLQLDIPVGFMESIREAAIERVNNLHTEEDYSEYIRD